VLNRLTLQNFKSFQSAEIPLEPLTLLVGTNASGKSNIRDALRVLHGVGLGYTLAEILGEKYGTGGIRQWGGIRGGAREAAFRSTSKFRLKVELNDPAQELPLTYELTVDVSDTRSGPRVMAETLYDSAGQRVFRSRVEYSEHLIHAGYDFREEFDSQMPLAMPGSESSTEDGRPLRRLRSRTSDLAPNRPTIVQIFEGHRGSASTREQCSRVLRVLQSMRFLDLDPEAMRQPSVPGQHILGDRGENLSSVLQAICEDESRKQTLLGWLRALTPMDAVDFEFIADFSGKVLVHLVESNGQKISALSASDGTLRFLALVAVLLSPDTGRIFFFEELDTGLHPTRLHLLVQLIQQACRNHGVQVIGTTHNPALLTFLDEQARKDALLIYRTESAPDSRIRRIADLPDIENILAKQDLGRLLASGWLEDAAIFSEPDEEEGA
jgi:predicted ATPase